MQDYGKDPLLSNQININGTESDSQHLLHGTISPYRSSVSAKYDVKTTAKITIFIFSLKDLIYYNYLCLQHSKTYLNTNISIHINQI